MLGNRNATANIAVKDLAKALLRQLAVAGSTVRGWFQADAIRRQSARAAARRVFSVRREIRWRWTLK